MHQFKYKGSKEVYICWKELFESKNWNILMTVNGLKDNLSVSWDVSTEITLSELRMNSGS